MKSSELGKKFKGIGIKDRTLLIRLTYNLSKIATTLELIYKDSPVANMKAVATICATLLLKPYDNKEELEEVIERMKIAIKLKLVGD